MSSEPTGKNAQKLPQAPSLVERWFPIALWLPRYDWRKNVPGDLLAALGVSALIIPIGMGYATVAGVPPQHGLYAVPIALVAYALLGGSKVLVLSVAGSVSAVSGKIISDFGVGHSEKAAALTAALALATGLIFGIAGVARLGWIRHFMSRPVMDGFVTGLAIHIIVGQFDRLVGVKAEGFNVLEKFWATLAQIGSWNVAATCLGVGSLLLIFALQNFVPKWPATLIAVVLASVAVGIWAPHVERVPRIPVGMPAFALPVGLDLSTWLRILAGAALITLVGLSEGAGASAAIAVRNHELLDLNQEFRAYGLGNLGSGFLGGIPVTGSLSQTSTAITAGAKTHMSNLMVAAIVMLTLLFLGPAFAWLPQSVLAAVVINAMWSSAGPQKIARLWRVDRIDFSLSLITFLLVLLWGLLPAMLLGICASIFYLVYRVSFPGSALLGRLEQGEFVTKRWVLGRQEGELHPDAKEIPGMVIYRFDAPLIFSNSEAFLATGRKILIGAAARHDLPRKMIVDCEAMVFMDETGAHSMKGLHTYLKEYGVSLALARLHEDPRRRLRDAGVLQAIGKGNIFETIREAVDTGKD
jgi:high affinity sulfate transporter 1